MNTLVVRSLTPAGIPGLWGLEDFDTFLDAPAVGVRYPEQLVNQIAATMPFVPRRNRVYVALLDGALCAAVTARPQSHRYRWDVVSLAATPALLRDHASDCNAVWTSLLEFAIGQAGQARAKRLFASAFEDSPAYHGLRSATFEPFTRFLSLRGTLPREPTPRVEGFRRQEDSDVWSIHQLYHHVTPLGVQHAEALTSAAWETPVQSPIARAAGRPPVTNAFVVDSAEGIIAHCTVSTGRDGPTARILIEERHRCQARDIAFAAARGSSVGPGSTLRVVIPAYAGELAGQFADRGFFVESERVALIRHTTAPALVISRAVAPLAESQERVPRGAPTYCNRMKRPTTAATMASGCQRMESMAS
ncbi:MAG TPA: hypothetical protein VMM78_05275 [Thermomicrobiales bacterium]|nr:hypothetical protein [Thermomicrobiales bacterium]